MGEGSEHQEQAEPGKVHGGFLASVSERDWRYIAALGCAVLISTLVAGYGYSNFRSYQRQHEYERVKATEHQAYEIEENVSGSKGGFPGTDQIAPTKHTDAATYYDLKAQQDMSEWTYSMLWVGIVGLLASVVGIGFVYANLREMQAQTLATREIGESQTRAWVLYQGIGHGPVTNSKVNGKLVNSGLVFNVAFQNYGQSPAFIVSSFVQYKVLPYDAELPDFEIGEAGQERDIILGPQIMGSSAPHILDDQAAIEFSECTTAIAVSLTVKYLTMFDQMDVTKAKLLVITGWIRYGSRGASGAMVHFERTGPQNRDQ